MSRLFSERVLKSIYWHKKLTTKEYFEENIRLLKGKVRGFFDTSETPHLEKIFESSDNKDVKIIVLKVASQTQKTTYSLGMIMKWVDTDYHDIFYMIPRAKDIKKFLNFKIQPFINGCSSVKEKLEEYIQDEKERKNSFFYKTSQNMLAILSSNDTKSITAKYAVFDEAAEMPPEIIEEAKERFKDYGDDYKMIIVSTQIHKDDAINRAFNLCEVKYVRHLKCHKCESYFVPLPKDLKIMTIEDYEKKINTDTLTQDEIYSDYIPYASRNAYLECPNCGSAINDTAKKNTIAGGHAKWIPVRIVDTEDEIKYIPTNEKEYFESVGFDMSSMLSKNVTIKSFAEKELACRIEKNPLVQRELYEKFYVGWWNLLYKPNTSTSVNKSDMLLLCNKVDFGLVPENISHLHMGVDLQKDRLYYVVAGVEYQDNDVEFEDGINLNVIQYGELYAGLNNDDFVKLQEIMEATYKDKKGKEYKISTIGCDIRGFSQNNENSRSSLMLDFIFNYAYKLKQYGVVDWDNYIYPTWGVDKFTNPTFEAQGYKTTKLKRKVIDEELEIKAIVFSNIKIKSLLENMIERGIAKAKADKDGIERKYSTNLLKITKEMCNRWEDRQKLKKRDRNEKHSLEAHLTSEQLSNIDENGKVLKEPRYIKKYPSARNDYLDCIDIILTQIKANSTHKFKKPADDKKDIDIPSSVKSAFDI